MEDHLNPEANTFYGREQTVYFTVEYDPIWGFPKEISFDVDRILDEQYVLTAEQFVAMN